MSTATMTPRQIGERVGRAIADTVISERMPTEWTGIDPQDADQFTAAGLVLGSPEWADAEDAAREEYERTLAGR